VEASTSHNAAGLHGLLWEYLYFIKGVYIEIILRFSSITCRYLIIVCFTNTELFETELGYPEILLLIQNFVAVDESNFMQSSRISD
jgi:hypothetical protein